jgi:hypothetical protein
MPTPAIRFVTIHVPKRSRIPLQLDLRATPLHELHCRLFSGDTDRRM